MPSSNVPASHEYADDRATLIVTPAEADGLIKVSAASTGVACQFELSIIGAQRLSSMLGAAVTSIVHRGMR